MEKELSARLSKGKIAQFVEYDEVEAGEIIGHAAFLAAAGHHIQGKRLDRDGLAHIPVGRQI